MKRAVDTVADFAEKNDLPVKTIDGFRERKVDSCWIDDFSAFARRQWHDFHYKLADGECLGEVQDRNIAALNTVLEKYPGKNIAVGSHGTALSMIINYYDNSFGYEDFEKIRYPQENCKGNDSTLYFRQLLPSVHVALRKKILTGRGISSGSASAAASVNT